MAATETRPTGGASTAPTVTAAAEAEERRLNVLQRLGILDTPPEERFEVFTRLAASVTRAKVATISLIDRDRVWFKSARGLPAEVKEVPRDIAACSLVLTSPDEVLVVPDARLDPRLKNSPLVTGDLGMRFYAGAPLKAPTGEVVGSLCVIDRAPRDADADTVQALRDLAEGVSTALCIHEMSELALKDPVTGLGNRRMFEESLAAAIEAARRAGDGTLVAAALIDLDRFKAFNDILGHGGGDAVLREVGDRIARALRPGDLAARLGGDEFGVLLVADLGEDPEGAITGLVTQVLDSIRGEPLQFEGHVMPLNASAGVALRHADPAVPTAETASALLRNADIALYQARQGERGQVRLFRGDSARGIGSKHTLAVDLRNALAGGGRGLRLVLQPIRRVADPARIAGYEALVRWTHPVYGPVAPDSFVPVAERSGLAPALDIWVLNEACRLIATAPAPGPMIAVNITPYFLASPDFLATVDAALARHGVAPDRLCLELTERVLLDEPARVQEVTRALAERGIQVALDDFGAGHASFGTLTAINVTKVKLDRALIRGIAAEDAAAQRVAAVVRGVIGICRELGLTVLVEGVETAEQLARLRELGADEAQGWHYGRPAPPEQLLARG